MDLPILLLSGAVAGTLAGLLARALVPGREPQGAVGTVVIGIAWSVLGLFALSWALKRPTFNPISPLGFFAAVGGSFFLVIVYRIAAIRCPSIWSSVLGSILEWPPLRGARQTGAS